MGRSVGMGAFRRLRICLLQIFLPLICLLLGLCWGLPSQCVFRRMGFREMGWVSCEVWWDGLARQSDLYALGLRLGTFAYGDERDGLLMKPVRYDREKVSESRVHVAW